MEHNTKAVSFCGQNALLQQNKILKTIAIEFWIFFAYLKFK